MTDGSHSTNLNIGGSLAGAFQAQSGTSQEPCRGSVQQLWKRGTRRWPTKKYKAKQLEDGGHVVTSCWTRPQ